MKQVVLVLVLGLMLTGCATRYCERGVQVYESAAEKAPLVSPDGLQVPEPDPNFAIPEATGADVKYATPTVDAAGRSRTDCLDTPPPLVVVSPPRELEPAYEDDVGFESESDPDEGLQTSPDSESEMRDDPEAEPVEL